MSASSSSVSVESVGHLERRMTLRVPSEQVDSQVGGRLREIARTARIKGFRPGKVPTSVVEQRYGDQVRAEVVDDLLRRGFDEAIRDNALRIAGNPSIEPASEKDGELEYVATFELMPDFGDIDVSRLEIERPVASIEDGDIDRMIENLRAQRRSWTAVNRAAKDGDAVDIETWSEGEGGERIPSEGVEDATAVIGAKSVLPELEQALVGMSAGDEKDVELSFPEGAAPQLAGKTVQVHVKAVRVSEPVLPEVDAAFIRSFGVKSGEMDQFRTEIRANLERELKGALMNRLRRAVGEQLVEAYSDVELPPRLVEAEARQMAWQAMQQQGIRGELPESAHEPFMDAARKRTLVGLLVGEIARRNELRLDPKRANELLRLIASTYEEPQQVIDLYRNDPQLMNSLQSRAMEEQVIDWIAERAQHTEKQMSFQDAISQ